MSTTAPPSLERLTEEVRRLPAGDLKDADVRRPEFLVEREGNIELFWAPFDHTNTAAKVVLVGITPGAKQMREAFAEARAALGAGDSVPDALRRAKAVGSFAGPLRANLIRMLDALGLPDRLGIQTSATLWSTHNDLVHFTSAVRHPVFVDGGNYTGYKPDMLRSPLLRRYVDEVLGPELASVPDALIVPLGGKVAAAVDRTIRAGHVTADRVLLGFPHPSGGNGHRERQFHERFDDMHATVTAWSP